MIGGCQKWRRLLPFGYTRLHQGWRCLSSQAVDKNFLHLSDEADATKRFGEPRKAVRSKHGTSSGTNSGPMGGANLPLKFCIVGSGPAGFYTADKLLKAFPSGHVTLLDRLPSPFGLVRTGVAPDHPETKFVTNQFTKVATQERCSFLGNVTVGRDVTLAELREMFHAVVFSYGAEDDKKFGIPGENLANCISAREFVWWYNGHPDYVDLKVDLQSMDTAVILGQGNVALDCARILLRRREELQVTDISEQAMESLRSSKIRTVHLVGRRGAAQVACTAKEVRELLGLKDVSVTVDPTLLVASATDEDDMKRTRSRRRVFDLLTKAAQSEQAGSGKRINFLFYRSPVQILADAALGSTVAVVRLEKTRMTGGGGGSEQRATGTGEFEDISCGLVLRSIGYRSLPIQGLPFDSKRGTVPHLHGRVLQEVTPGTRKAPDDAPVAEEGLYVVGWVKRGPTGIIGTNEIDAVETVASIVEDSQQLAERKLCGPGSIQDLLHDRQVRCITFEDWQVIDWEELRNGKEHGKQREKFVTVEEMLHLVGKQT